MIEVAHVLTAKPPQNSYLKVEYHYNPEAKGFPKSSSEEWKTSEWNSVRINNDPAKVEFINKLKDFHTVWHTKVKEGFNY